MPGNELLQRYAKLIVRHGLNLQPGQVLNINAEAIHRDFALLIGEEAYRVGARYVQLQLIEPRLARSRLLFSAPEDLAYVPKHIEVQYSALVEERGANLRLAGSEYPDLLADLDPARVNTVRLHQHLAMKRFYDEGIGKCGVHWTVAAAATAAWGEKVFPGLDPDAAGEKLWSAIFEVCRVNDPRCLELWQEHNERLHERARSFTAMKIKELRFSGPGTSLTVGLSERAVFRGGSDQGPYGEHFEPNIPTEEVFTTPDWRKTEGTVRTTRPFYINGKLVRDLVLHFKNGEITDFSAAQGGETFQTYISSDPGGKRLGEVALVGIDSPIFKSGLTFQEILLDENAACHIAVGSAYKFCLRDGDTLNKEELLAIGCNESTVHTDMMISSPEVDVTAVCYDGREQRIIVNGAWNI